MKAPKNFGEKKGGASGRPSSKVNPKGSTRMNSYNTSSTPKAWDGKKNK